MGQPSSLALPSDARQSQAALTAGAGIGTGVPEILANQLLTGRMELGAADHALDGVFAVAYRHSAGTLRGELFAAELTDHRRQRFLDIRHCNFSFRR